MIFWILDISRDWIDGYLDFVVVNKDDKQTDRRGREGIGCITRKKTKTKTEVERNHSTIDLTFKDVRRLLANPFSTSRINGEMLAC